MPYATSAVEILIASPSDVRDARDVIRSEISEWNIANSRARRLSAVAVGWETHAVPELGGPPQAVIDRQLVKQCDLLVAIFRGRLGTPTLGAPSGTAYEIEEFMKAGKPVMPYALKGEPMSAGHDDVAQFAALTEYLADLRKRGLLGEVADLQALGVEFRRHLQTALQRFEPSGQPQRTPAVLGDREIELMKALHSLQGRTQMHYLGSVFPGGRVAADYYAEKLRLAGLVETYVVGNADMIQFSQLGRQELVERGLLR